jgi:hypothetical protein
MAAALDNDPHNGEEAAALVSPSRSFRKAEKNLAAADRCLAAAAYSLNFDIAEVWTFVPDPAAAKSKASDIPAIKPACVHVYAQPATLENYRAKLVGIWNNGERERRHKLSPGVSAHVTFAGIVMQLSISCEPLQCTCTIFNSKQRIIGCI